MSLLRKCVAGEIRGPCSHPQGWETALVWIKAQNREGPRREQGEVSEPVLPPPRASGPALPAATARAVGPYLHRPHLHLRHLVAVVVAFPRLPVDAVCKGLVGTPEVETIEV